MSEDLIRRSDAISALGEEPDVWFDDDGYEHGLRDQWRCDVNAINAVPSAQPDVPERNVGKWIPVTEQTLPNHNSVVVVCGKKGTWDFGTYRGLVSTNINFWNWKNNTVKEVHWWMYKEDALPKPWEGGEA